MNYMRLPLLKQLRNCADEAWVRKRWVKRLFRVGIERSEKAAPPSKPVYSYITVALDTRSLWSSQSQDVDLVASACQLTRERLDGKIAPSDQRGRVAVRCLEDPHPICFIANLGKRR